MENTAYIADRHITKEEFSERPVCGKTYWNEAGTKEWDNTKWIFVFSVLFTNEWLYVGTCQLIILSGDRKFTVLQESLK